MKNHDNDAPAAPDQWPATKIEMWAVEDLEPYARNARMHPEQQIEQIMGSMRRFGFTIPMLISEEGMIIAGHGRLEAAKRLGFSEVPVMVARGWTEDMVRAYCIADNRLGETSQWDNALLEFELTDLGLTEDPRLAFDMGFVADDLNAIISSAASEATEAGDGDQANKAEARKSLAGEFGVVPFSVLNAREGWWLERKRAWLALGIRSEVGRGETAATGGSPEPLARANSGQQSVMSNGKRPAAAFGQDLMRGEGRTPYKKSGVLMPSPSGADPRFYEQKREAEKREGRTLTTTEFIRDHYTPRTDNVPNLSTSGTSIFDPVLSELMYRWFSPPGGQVLDPFAGGSVRGVVASGVGREYTGIELREEQVEANRKQGDDICEDDAPAPIWITGDSLDQDKLLPEGFEADFVFSCPPYADLEVYSEDPRDISAMDYPEFLAAYREIIARSVARLRDDRFAAFVVGEVRAPYPGGYRNFVADTIAAFRDAGLEYYNEIILVTPAGSLPVRIGKQFNSSRKVGKTHQNILVFCKGDPKRAAAEIGAVSFPLGDDPDEADEDGDDPADAGPDLADFTPDLTPIEQHGDVWAKRDDLWTFAGAPGGKARTCAALSQGAPGLVTAGSRASPQVNIVAHIAQRLGIPCRAHTPQGELSPEVRAAKAAGAEVVQHKAGYNNVIIARAREDAAERGWVEIPFGMECEEAVTQTRAQVRDIPEGVERIVVPVGSGMSLAGILWGLIDAGLTIPVLGVVVGADPTKRLDAFAPSAWRDLVEIVTSPHDYHKAVEARLGDIQLDPHYEAKCMEFVRPGDLLWCVGVRQSDVRPGSGRRAVADPDQWTFGVEAEMSDFDRRSAPALDRCYITSEVGSVNSDGTATWWENPLGGEINTYPTGTPEEQAEIFAGFLRAFPEAAVNYRSTLHAHIRVPGLRDDLRALIRAFEYSQRWTEWVCDQVYRIEATPEFKAADKGGRNWRYINVGTVMPPEWRVQQIMAATTAEDFFRRHMLNKAGEYRPLQATRYAVNFLMLHKQDTVEFRHFLGGDQPAHVQTVCEYAREFMTAALVTGEPMPEIFERNPHWEFPPAQVTDQTLEAGYRETEKKGDRGTPKYILLGEKVGDGSASKRWAPPA
ncbi:MAG: pyridoxal-phosphate dependent enzyme [Loktanella sp.]|nr:pyridoxal-phosphate dependent enzyme [Loktanella sp.]